jgi:UDP-glucose 4-epimerase
MTGESVLITGGAGLIGSHIADQVLDAGASDVIIFDNLSRGRHENIHRAMSSGRVRIVEADLRDTEAVGRAMAGVGVVFHQAAVRITQCAEEPRLAKEVLIDGTFNVLEAAVNAGVRKVVAASSASIYGLAEQFPTPESHHPYANRTLYGAAKAFSEGLLRSFNEMYGLQYVALRYFNVYGPRMDVFGAYTEVLIRWMEAIVAGRRPMIFGDGEQTMDFVYVEDVARANLLAASSDASDEVFNVGTGVETSLKALAELLLEIMESNLTPEYSAARKVNPVPRRVAAVDAARQRIGFTARVGLEEGLRSLVSWWQQERAVARS